MMFFQIIGILFKCFIETISGFFKMLFSIKYFDYFTFGFIAIIGIITVITILRKMIKG